ncbi:DUF3263 domain-containing protein [Rhodococcus erythropolis]|uniref:DUF3263 domain-containing protein n=1 Tax=Rhodococcus erythropolis TaxID=1833 RepID=A0AAX3ZZP1_RHOER|nr:DUF3263 domain-containing protein [Rhodococcus erythropolis]WMN01712.1 DUF3263 domain-containing protein [Rhodococcus erythropolis]
MNDNRKELLAHALRWAPYGGGTEDILPLFGLSISEYHRRLSALLETSHSASIDPQTVTHLRDQCRKYLLVRTR